MEKKQEESTNNLRLTKESKKDKETTNQQRKKIENINDCEMRGESL